MLRLFYFCYLLIAITIFNASVVQAFDGLGLMVQPPLIGADKNGYGKIQRIQIIADKIKESKTVYGRADARSVVLSPSGSRYAFVRKDNALCIRGIAAFGDRSLAPLEGITASRAQLVWQSEEWIYFCADSPATTIYRLSTHTSAVEQVTSFYSPIAKFGFSVNGRIGTVVVQRRSGSSGLCFYLSGDTMRDIGRMPTTQSALSTDGHWWIVDGPGGGFLLGNVARFTFAPLTFDAPLGSTVSVCKFSVNSNEWLLCREYGIDKNSQIVVYNSDGTRWVTLGKNSTDDIDLWTGTPALALMPRPVIAPDSTTLTCVFTEEDIRRVVQCTLSVVNKGSWGTHIYALGAAGNASWITTSVTGSEDRFSVVVGVLRDSLGQGSHTGSIRLTSSEAQPVDITVLATVAEIEQCSTIVLSIDKKKLALGRSGQAKVTGYDHHKHRLQHLPRAQYKISGPAVIDSLTGVITASATKTGLCTLMAKIVTDDNRCLTSSDTFRVVQESDLGAGRRQTATTYVNDPGQRSGAFGIYVLSSNLVTVTIPVPVAYTIDIVGIDGKLVSSLRGVGPVQKLISNELIPSGMYLVRLHAGSVRTSQLVMIGN